MREVVSDHRKLFAQLVKKLFDRYSNWTSAVSKYPAPRMVLMITFRIGLLAMSASRRISSAVHLRAEAPGVIVDGRF